MCEEKSRLRIGESPRICPFLKNNADEAPKSLSPVFFQEWTDYSDFFLLKIRLNRKALYIKKQFVFLLMYMRLSSDHYWEVMESFVRASYRRCILT